MSCSRCLHLHEQIDIRLSSDLTRVIDVVRSNILNGILREDATGNKIGAEAFDDVDREGPWDDIVGYRFECTSCGSLFYLSAETYHGAGGEWKPMKPRG